MLLSKIVSGRTVIWLRAFLLLLLLLLLLLHIHLSVLPPSSSHHEHGTISACHSSPYDKCSGCTLQEIRKTIRSGCLQKQSGKLEKWRGEGHRWSPSIWYGLRKCLQGKHRFFLLRSLQVSLFHKCTQGISAKSKDLEKVFGTHEHSKCARIILDKGDLQISDREREAHLDR